MDNKIKCPKCNKEKRDFLIQDGECDSCHMKRRRDASKIYQNDLEDLRAWRNSELLRTDPPSAYDAPKNLSEEMLTYRQELRDMFGVGGKKNSINKIKKPKLKSHINRSKKRNKNE